MKFIFTFLVFLAHLSLSFAVSAEDEWVTVEPVLRRVSLTGFTRAQATMPLAAEVEGKISGIFADVGDPIPKDEKFACLNDTFVEIDIKSAKNEMSQHYIDVKYYKKEVARHQQLVSKKTIAVSVLDGMKRDLDNARQALLIATMQKKRLEELGRRHCIEAPEGWLVIDRSIEPGQWVNQGEVVAHVGNYSQMKVPVTLSHQELAALKREANNIQLLISESKLKVPAIIEHVSPAFDEKTRKILVDLLIKENGSKLLGGMRVELLLNMPDSKGASFSISALALEERFEQYVLHRKDGKKVKVKLLSEQSNGKVTISSREIKIGDQFKIIKQ